MARGKPLTEYEKGQIVAYQEMGKSKREISRLLNRSDCVIRHFLADTQKYGTLKAPGRKKVVSERSKRAIVNLASNSLKSCAEIKRELDQDIHRSTIWRVLNQSPHIIRMNLQTTPRLTDVHKGKRLEFARNNMSTHWNKVCFLLQFL